MSDTVDARISPSLHPDVVALSVEGYDSETAPVLAHVVTAFSEMYEGLRSIHTARESARRNPTWNDAQQVLATQDLADKAFARAARHVDASRSSLAKGIESLEKDLTAPIEARAAHPIAVEIRAHAKALPKDKRHAFISEAIRNADAATIEAVLGAPAYLSGLDAEFVETYTRMWRERVDPAAAKRLKAMQSAKALLERNAPLLHGEVAKAVGMAPDKVKRLRDAKTAAEKAFIVAGD